MLAQLKNAVSGSMPQLLLPVALLVFMGAGSAIRDHLFAAEKEQTVKVRLKSFDLKLPEQIQAGKVVFEVKNDDSVEHCFAIKGQGVDAKLEMNVAPGETKFLELDLAPGNYRVSCPLENHAQRGMIGTLTVVRKKG